MTHSKRIIIVGNFGRKELFRRYFNTEAKLANGFIRAGHHVVCFSDRDHAREATILNTQSAGKQKMAAKLLELTNHYKPHMILFGHTDLLPTEFYDQIRRKVKGVKLATFCVDALFRADTIVKFKARAEQMDSAFITTGDRRKLTAIDPPAGRLYFMPNPVDASMETAHVYTISRQELRFDGQFLGTGIGEREAQLSALQDALPDDYRFDCGGRAFGSVRIDSTDYLHRLAQSATCPNLPLDDTNADQMAYLYSSDRIAQVLGQGVTMLTPKASGFADLYEGGVIEYSSRQDLAEQMVALRDDDTWRRKIGEIGHRVAHSRTDTSRIAAYILAILFEEKLPEIFWDGTAI